MKQLSRKDFFCLFMWGIQFDPELYRISQIERKSKKGTYWTPAMMGFLDRLGSKLVFETDIELGVFTDKQDKPDKWVDMVWTGKDFQVFIEHEGSPDPKLIGQAIKRLEGSSKSIDGTKEADLRVLVSYPSPKGVDKLKEFAGKDNRNLSIWYPYEDWPRPNNPVDLTKFKSFPEELMKKDMPGFYFFGKHSK